MPDIYDIDYNQQTIELLPPDKRYKTTVAFLQACLKSTCQYLRDALFGDYRNGSTAGQYAAGTYNRGDKVVYKKGVYVSLIDNNTDLPTVATSWYFQQQFFIGLNERLAYNGNNLTLTYALNKWFGGTFRQPGQGTSDIYITTHPIETDLFQIGYTEAESNAIAYYESEEDAAIGYSDAPIGAQFNFTVNIPSALFASIASATDAATALVNSYVSTYAYAGLVWDLNVY